MHEWPYKIQSWSREEIIRSVESRDWQVYRGTLHGLRTGEKLQRLTIWLDLNAHNQKAKCQVDNYLNALKRGGFLDDDGKVKK